MNLTYDDLRMWRDLCEYLNDSWYKCEEVDYLYTKLPHCTVYRPEKRTHRQEFWDSWQLQLISWGGHPIIRYSESAYRDYKKWRGWTLFKDWEIKIDFLEKIVLLNIDPNTLDKPWIAAIEKARQERLRREAEQRRWEEEQQQRWRLQQEEWNRELERRARLTPDELEAEREARRQAIKQQLREEEERTKAERAAAFASGFCGWCKAPVAFLMMDCPNCGKSYE